MHPRSVLGFVALAGLFAAVVWAKARAVQARCAMARATPRPFLPLPAVWRATLAGGAIATGVSLQLAGRPTAGGALVALAMVAAAHRAPCASGSPRGPGRWLALRPCDAFAPPPYERDWFDIGTSCGRLAAAVACTVGLAGVRVLHRLHPDLGWVAAIDLAALVPIAFTGCASQLRPDRARAAAPVLEGVYRALASVPGLRVVPWARVIGGGTIDELRLLLAPRAPLPGLLGVELAVAFCATPTGWAPYPEVLVRVLEATSASAQLARCAPAARSSPGRRPDERVIRLFPRAATRAGTVALARELSAALTDRRSAGAPPWAGPERRRAAPRPPAAPATAHAGTHARAQRQLSPLGRAC